MVDVSGLAEPGRYAASARGFLGPYVASERTLGLVVDVGSAVGAGPRARRRLLRDAFPDLLKNAGRDSMSVNELQDRPEWCVCGVAAAERDWLRSVFVAPEMPAREDLVKTRTATINRLLWRVHELDPGWAPPAKSLDLAKHQQALRAHLDSALGGGVIGLVAELARDELSEVVELTHKINTLAKRIEQRTRPIAPTLLAMPGVGPLTAAKIVGEAAGVTRSKSEAAFARHPGIAPIPVWSGNTAGRVRLTRSGNRQLNAAVHRIAITQIRLDGLGQAYYRKKKAEGMSSTEALRCLKRRLARIVYRHLHTDQNAAAPRLLAAA